MDIHLQKMPYSLAVVLVVGMMAATVAFASSGKKTDVKRIYGRIQYVTAFPDYKVQVTDNFPDLRVEEVTAFPNGPGKWQIVNEFPDYKIQKVDSFPDFTIQYVKAFPGSK